jgi:hypothetical protein
LKEALMFRRAMAVGIVSVACVLAFTGGAFAQDKTAQAAKAALAAVAGKYEGTAATPNGDMAFVCELRVENGNIVGSIGTGDFQIAVTSGTLVGDKLTLNLDMGGNPITAVGTLKDGHFEGQGSQGGAIVMTKTGAAPAAAPAPASNPAAAAAPTPAAAPSVANSADPISGDWDGLVDTPDQQRAIVLKLKLDAGKVSGEVGSDMGSMTLQSGTWADGALTIVFPFQSGDTITMVARLQEGKLVGTLSIGDQMTVAWVAVKKK